MNKFHLLTIILIVLIGNKAIGQTKIIAHKSHSGKMINFKAKNYPDNFGLPPSSIDSIIKISETKIVEISHYPFRSRDTMKIEFSTYLFGYPKIPIDSIRKNYPYIKYIGFDKKKK